MGPLLQAIWRSAGVCAGVAGAVAILFAVAGLLPAAQAAASSDGRWEGELRYCGGHATLVVEVEDGTFRAPFRLQGGKTTIGSRDMEFAGRITSNGSIEGGRIIGRAASVISGKFENGKAAGGGTDRRCTGDWSLVLVEPATPKSESQAGPEGARQDAANADVRADGAAPLIDARKEIATNEAVVVLEGSVADASRVVEFAVDSRPVVLDGAGRFSLSRAVPLGESTIVITAMDEWGNFADHRITVRRSATVVAETEAGDMATRSADTSPPLIAVPPRIETASAIVEITGGVLDNSALIEVTVAGEPVTLSAGGQFSLRRGVPRGVSEIEVTALDEWGNQTIARIIVSRTTVTTAADPATDPESRLALEPEPEPDVATDRAPPEIALPVLLETERPEVVIEGQVTDGSTIADVRVDDRPVRVADDGSFKLSRAVAVGDTEVVVVAIDEWGNRAERKVQVTRRLLDLDLGKFHALVIGNNEYVGMPVLKTAIADAEAVSDILADDYGFEVQTLTNATRSDVIGAMSALRARLTFDDNLLIYYAGHGIVDPITERGYWLPVDAAPDNPTNWVSNADITDMLKAIPARHLLVIADSCYSGTLVRAVNANLETWEDRRAWLSRMAAKRSRTALSSGGLEPVTDSGGDGHSVFARTLINVLRDNTEVIDAQNLFRPVRERVAVNANQTPQYSDVRLAGHDGGDFIFVPHRR
jgi:uncharacterized caspase-like protein